MTHWHKYASAALAVGLFAALPAAAQPGPRGGSEKEIEAELTRLRERMKSLEAKLASAKEKGKAAAKGEQGKRDGKDRPGFGRRGGPRGPRHGFGHRGPRGPMHGFGRTHGRWGRGGFGPHGPGSHMRGKGEEKGQKGSKDEKGQKGAQEPKGFLRSKEAPKGGGASGLEKKLDQLQKDLEEIRRELKRR